MAYSALTNVGSDAPQRFQNELYNSLSWANQQLGRLQEFSDPTANKTSDLAATATSASKMLGDWAGADRARWESVYVPLQDQIISDARNWDSAENRMAARGSATANVAQQMDAADAAASRQLEGYGVKPSDTRFTALNRNAKLARATAGAAASDVADRARQQEGVGLRMAANQMGATLPGQATAEAQGATNAAGTAAGIYKTAADIKNAPTFAFRDSLGNPVGWANALTGANNAYTGAVSATNKGKQDEAELAEKSGGGFGSIAGLVGGLGMSALTAPMTGGGSFLGNLMKFERGGDVPEGPGGGAPPVSATGGGGYVDPSMSPSGGVETDDVPAVAPSGPARLNANEFVMPQRATEYYGTKFFMDLIAKADKAMGIEPQPVGPEQGEFARGGRVDPRMGTRFNPAKVPPPQRTHMRATDPRRAA